MNRSSTYTTDIDRIRKGLNAIGLPVTVEPLPDFTYPIVCCLYRNPDGSIRWLWPKNAGEPDFLRFYQVESQRAKQFVGVVRWLFHIGLGHRMAHDRLTLYTSESGRQLLSGSQITRWALDTGVAGPDRKLVIWHCMKSGDRYLTKISVGTTALTALRQEARALRQLQQAPFLKLHTPKLSAYSLRFVTTGFLIQEDLRTTYSPQMIQLTQLPAYVLYELVSRNWHTEPLHQADFWKQAQVRITKLRETNDPRIPASLLNKLDGLMRGLNDQIPVPLAAAHGNFTPWTVVLTEKQVSVVDWERYADGLPGLYDLFHFLYQSATVPRKQGYGATRKLIDATLNRPEWLLFRERYGLDTGLAEMLYLIHAITSYLAEFSQQTNWPPQVNGLLTTWSDALTHWLSHQDMVSGQRLTSQNVSGRLPQQDGGALPVTYQPAQHLPNY